MQVCGMNSKIWRSRASHRQTRAKAPAFPECPDAENASSNAGPAMPLDNAEGSEGAFIGELCAKPHGRLNLKEQFNRR